MYRICGVTETGQDYLYDLFLRAVTFVAGPSVCEQAKLVPESGERLGRFGALPQQNGESLGNLNGPGQWRPCQGTEVARASEGDRPWNDAKESTTS